MPHVSTRTSADVKLGPGERPPVFLPGHRLDRRFSFQCRTLAGTNLLVNQNDPATAAGVSGGGPGIVLLAQAFHVLGDAGVERAVAAAQQVDEPFHDRRTFY